MQNPLGDVESLCEITLGKTRHFQRLRFLSVALSLASVGLFAGLRTYTSVGVNLIGFRRLAADEDGPSSASEVNSGASLSAIGPTVEEIVPPPESAALNDYFKELMGLPRAREITLHDGNKCFDDEEEFEDLCYRKCTLLTNATFGLRTSAWTCCQATNVKDCFMTNQNRDLGLCSGYDVAGDGKSCPHAPGRCLESEEIFLGQCYRKCSLLTNNTKPYRTSAISCCETKFAISCFEPRHVSLNTGFAEGGGKGDANPSTPANAHEPMTTLTR